MVAYTKKYYVKKLNSIVLFKLDTYRSNTLWDNNFEY